MKKLFLHILILATSTLAYAQKTTDNFNMSYNVSNYENIRIHNFNGNVTVKTKPGNQFSMKVTRILKAKTNSKLQDAKEEVYLDTTVVDGEFVVFMVAPNKHFKMDDDGGSFYQGENWNDWSKNNIKKYSVEYEFEIEATIPANKNLYAATHHKDVEVNGIQGNTTVKSHHGSVYASTGGEKVIARTHHGDVTVEHSNKNVSKGIYKTHHGDITTSFPDVSALISMDSHHGSFYIDFDYEHVAQLVSSKKNGGKTKYKYGGETNIKVGNGSGKFTYRTHHGDTYINKI